MTTPTCSTLSAALAAMARSSKVRRVAWQRQRRRRPF
jgi:hypothetical protein